MITPWGVPFSQVIADTNHLRAGDFLDFVFITKRYVSLLRKDGKLTSKVPGLQMSH